MSRIVTFYSYKGGVGRTFALANIAVLLAKRGKRVLLMDWDLEAPGLHRYFRAFVERVASKPNGLIHLLTKAANDPSIPWESYVTRVPIVGCEPIHMIASGDQASDYVECVRSFSWNLFFENHAGGDLLDRWRTEWKASYDFVLVDSRTGITDSGGVCTIYLPDILVLVFSANEQSFERGVQVATGVQKARRDLAVPRPPLAVLPLPGRFDGRDEIDEAQFWLNRFAEELKPFYDDWLPKGLKPRQILELTKIPYITKFSFGEPLPVVTQGITDPEFPGFYLANIARLLVSDFQEAQQIVSPESVERLGSIAEFRSILASVPIDEAAIERMMPGIQREIGSSSKFAELLTEAGVSLLRQQRFDSAESYFRRALAMNADVLGSSHPAYRSSMNHLAELLMTSGRLSEAEPLYRQIVETDTDSDPTALFATLNNLAEICRAMGRHEEAVDLYRRALQTAEVSGRPGDPAVLATYNTVAKIYREMGRREEAVESYQRALQMAEMSGRPGDPTVLATYNNLAETYREMGRREEAVDLYRHALQMAEISGRPGDPAVQATYNNLAEIYLKLGRREEAVDLYQHALQMAEMGGQPGDPAVQTNYNNLAEIYREMGRREEAVVLYQHALQMAEMSGRPGHPAVQTTYNNLAKTYREMGRHEEAVETYRHALQMAEMSGRPGGRAVQATYNNLAKIYREMGRHEEAVETYRYALKMAETSGRPGDLAVQATYNNLAKIYREMGRHEEAVETYRYALKMAEMSGLPGDPAVYATYNNLAKIYHEMGRHEEAVETYQRALKMAEMSGRPGNPAVQASYNNLAEILIEGNRFEEAESLLRRSLAILAKTGRDTPDSAQTRDILVRLLQASGRKEEAVEVSDETRFDVLISYGMRDLPLVRDLAEKLTAKGLRVWFDQWQLQPGDSIKRAVTDAVASAASLLICIGQSGPSLREQELAKIVTRSAQRNQLIIPVLLPEGNPDQMPRLLREYQFIDLRRGLTTESLDILLNSITRPRRLS